MTPPAVEATTPCTVDLTGLIPEREWSLNRRVIDLVLKRKIPFALGGGLAFSAYSRRWRYTKDVDLFILPQDREPMVQVLSDAGLQDLYEKEPYDRSWIYRGTLEGVIIDLIWTLPNHRLEVDELWLTMGWRATVHDYCLPLIPPEELTWCKLYVMQYDRSDWPDVLNILYGVGPFLDWNRLLDRLGADVPVLAGAMCLFRWLCPERAHALPPELWQRLGLPETYASEDRDGARADLLDTRDWFGPTFGRTDG